MANQWFRLWHDMPNDPKWRTIARVSGQPVTAVIAVYLHVLVDASSNADERGRTHSIEVEDIATALDLDDVQVQAILDAMQGRVLEGDVVAGWEKRQPAREDGSAERAKAWRERKKEEGERTRTQANAEKRPDKDKEEDKDKNPPNPPCQGGGSEPEAKGRTKQPKVSLKTFVEKCSAAGEKPISGYEPLLRYVERSGLPMEFVQLCWEVFKDEFMPGGTNAARLQKDWRMHFLNYVRKGYYRLWFAKQGEDGTVLYSLSSQGLQAQRALAVKEAA